MCNTVSVTTTCSFFVLWIGHQVHRRSDHAATRRLRIGYPVVRCVSCCDSYAVASLSHVIWTRKKNNGRECDRDLADEEGGLSYKLLRPKFTVWSLYIKIRICPSSNAWQLDGLFVHRKISVLFYTVKWVRHQDLIPVRATDFSYLQRVLDRFWGPPSLLFRRNGDSLTRGKAAGSWIWPLSSMYCRGRMSGAIHSLPHMPFWRVKGRLYLYPQVQKYIFHLML
jgi:hypothetical protein